MSQIGMKQSGIQWIGMIPEEWELCKLKYIPGDDGLFLDGDWIESDIIEEEGVRYLTTGNVGAGRFKDQGSGYISEKSFNILHCLKVRPNDIIISRLNEPIGRSCLVPEGEDYYVIAVDNVVLRPDEKEWDKRFLIYAMNADGYAQNANLVARGSTMHRVSRFQLGHFKLPKPPKKEQGAIADYLDRECARIDGIIEIIEKQIELLKKYKQSLITETVTKGLQTNDSMKKGRVAALRIPSDWDEVKMSQAFVFAKGLNITKQDLTDEGVPVISYGQVHAKSNTGTGVSDELLRFIPNELARNSSALTRENDFIFADTSEDYAGVGNCVFVDCSDNLYAGYHSIIARPVIEGCYPKYLAYLFLTDCWRSQIRREVIGVKVFSITNRLLRNAFIIVPPNHEQRRVADFLDDKCSCIDSIIEEKTRQIDALTSYKKSMFYEYVTGKKRVKEAM